MMVQDATYDVGGGPGVCRLVDVSKRTYYCEQTVSVAALVVATRILVVRVHYSLCSCPILS